MVGTTIAAPQKSPSHHEALTRGSDPPLMAPPIHSETGPITALTSVPAASAPNSPRTERVVSSGRTGETRRCSSHAARTTSRRLPNVCPTADPRGSVEYWFTVRSPITTAGQKRSPLRYKNAIPAPTGSHTIEDTGPAKRSAKLRCAAPEYRRMRARHPTA